MRVLFISAAEPGDYSSGGNQRSNYIREALLRFAQVDTVVVSLKSAPLVDRDWDSDRTRRVYIPFSAGRRERAEYRSTARRIVAQAEAENDYDFIVARYFGLALLAPFKTHRKLIIDGDDMRQSGEGRPLLKRLLVHIRKKLIGRLAKRSFHVWLLDPRDRELLNGAHFSMLPNTAKQVATLPTDDASKRILMVGMLTYAPNEEGLRWFAREVLPDVAMTFPNVEFHAVGKYDATLAKDLPNVVFRGFVDDLAAEYASAAVVICPVWTGSGTQIKVVEALMAGRPAVVSSFSWNGFSDVLEAGTHLLVGNDRSEWVEHVTAVLRGPKNYEHMAETGRDVAIEAYGLDAFFERVAETLTRSRRS